MHNAVVAGSDKQLLSDKIRTLCVCVCVCWMYIHAYILA